MNLGAKIIRLRRREGWSQEELARQLDVSRQSVSKWEGGLSAPDLDKILLLSQIFGVSTDYLLKDEPIPDDSFPIKPQAPKLRRVTRGEAEAFIAVKRQTAPWIAFATVLCILSPIPLILLGAASELGRTAVSEEAAVGLGMIVLLVLCAIAVALYLACGMKTEPYAFFETEVFEAEPALCTMAAEQKAAYHPTYSKCCVAGTCLCILSVIPLFLSLMAKGENELALVGALAILMAVCAVGVALFIVSGVRMATYEKLLQEGDYTPEMKLNQRKSGRIAGIYWPVIVAIYLGYSFLTDDWHRGWVIWPVAALIFVSLSAALHITKNRKHE